VLRNLFGGGLVWPHRGRHLVLCRICGAASHQRRAAHQHDASRSSDQAAYPFLHPRLCRDRLAVSGAGGLGLSRRADQRRRTVLSIPTCRLLVIPMPAHRVPFPDPRPGLVVSLSHWTKAR
jgi:hypothetical protein